MHCSAVQGLVVLLWVAVQAHAETEIVISGRASAEDPLLGLSTVDVTGDDLAKAGFDSLTELDGRLPGLATFGGNPRTGGFAIRGLGNNQFNDGLDSSVGLYVDDVYLARQSYGAFALYDMSSVSLVRGPAGATRGFDSTAGEVSLQTQAPSFLRGGKLSLSAGDLGFQQLVAAVTGPLIDEQLAGRLSLYSRRRDGDIENVFTGKKLNNQDRLGVRGQLLWTPSSTWRSRLKLEYEAQDESCCASQLLGPVRPGVKASDDYMGYERPGTDPYERLADKDITPMGRLAKQGAVLTNEWQLASRQRLVSISHAHALAYDPARNDDGASLRLVTGRITANSHQVGQEFRWHRDADTARSVLGLSWLHQRLRGNETGELGEDIALWTLGGQLRQRVPFATRQNSGFLINALLPPETLDGLRVSRPYVQRVDTLSGFGSVDWHLQEDTSLTTGLRYTLSRRDADIQRFREGGNLSASPLSVTNSLAPLGQLLGTDLSGLTFDALVDSLVGPPFDRHDQREDTGISGRISLQHRLDHEQQAHVALIRGFKSGGINLDALSPRIAPQFAPEIAEGVELGWRGHWPDYGLRSSLTFYHTDVRDFQAVTYDDGDGLIDSPRQNNVISIPSVRLQGVEWDVSTDLRSGLSLQWGAAYSRAITREFREAPNEDTGRSDKDLSGRQLYNAPRWSGFASIEQRLPWSMGREVYAAIDHRFRSRAFAAVEQSRNSLIDSYQITDIRLGMRRVDGAWGVEAWARNALDTRYLASVSGLYGLGDYAGYAGEARMLGMTLEAAWGK